MNAARRSPRADRLPLRPHPAHRERGDGCGLRGRARAYRRAARAQGAPRSVGAVDRDAGALQARGARLGAHQERARRPRHRRRRRARARRRAVPGDGAARGSRPRAPHRRSRPSRADRRRLAAPGGRRASTERTGWGSSTATSSPRTCSSAGARSGTPIVKVLDFGIIKIAEERTAASQAGGGSWGRRSTWRPSSSRRRARSRRAADRYALGLVAYRLLTGEHVLPGRGDVGARPDPAPAAPSAFGARDEPWTGLRRLVPQGVPSRPREAVPVGGGADRGDG